MSFDIDEALSLQLQEAECLKNALVTQRGIITLWIVCWFGKFDYFCTILLS